MLKVNPSLSSLEFWHHLSVCRESIMADNFSAITFLQLLTPAMAAHGLTVTGVKISVLLLYRRIFINPAFGRSVVIVGTLCIAWLFASTFGQVFLCSPMSAAWNPNLIFSSKCKDFQAVYYGMSISNLILDLVILCMPPPIIWGLHLSRKKKLMCCGVFCLEGL